MADEIAEIKTKTTTDFTLGAKTPKRKRDPDCLYIEPCFGEDINLIEMFKIMHQEELDLLKSKEERKEEDTPMHPEEVPSKKYPPTL